MDYSSLNTPARLKWALRAFFVWCKKHNEKAALEALACELEGVDPVNPIIADGERLALQQARLEYYAQAVRLREANPALPELPPITQDNPHGDLVVLERWCGDVKPELPATTLAKAGAKLGRKKHRQRNVKNLTAKQLEAVQIFGECESNYSQTAKRLGITTSAAKDRIKAAYTKLGQQVPTKASIKKARHSLSLPLDRRRGMAVGADDDRRFR